MFVAVVRKSVQYALVFLLGVTLLGGQAMAIGSQKNPQSGAVGLEGTVPAPAPTQPPTVATPGNGQTITTPVTTVSGLCVNGLLVKVFDNNIFVGSAQCTNGSYSVQVSLFGGQNQVVVRAYDALDQASPDSNTLTLTYHDAQYAQFGTRVTLTSIYAKLGADPNTELDWPIVLSGGSGPYAISIDWGDGKPATLMSVPFAGNITLKYTYTSAGIYTVIVKAVDANGTTAYLQLVGVANGKAGQGSTTSGSSNNNSSGGTTTKTIVLWWPALILLPLIALAFWLGRRHELFALRRRLEQTRGS